MDRVLDLLSKRKWQKHCLRVNVAQPEDIEVIGSIKIAKICSNLLRKREKEPELYDAIKAIAPEWWGDETQITLKKDLVCKRHKDHGNKEHSWILWLGDFTGGALIFDDGTRVEGKDVWHKIDGHIHHWNEPHEGSKYSIVLYRRTMEQKGKRLADAVKAKRAALKAQTALQSEARAPCTDLARDTAVERKPDAREGSAERTVRECSQPCARSPSYIRALVSRLQCCSTAWFASCMACHTYSSPGHCRACRARLTGPSGGPTGGSPSSSRLAVGSQ